MYKAVANSCTETSLKWWQRMAPTFIKPSNFCKTPVKVNEHTYVSNIGVKNVQDLPTFSEEIQYDICIISTTLHYD